ncbi:hypothetical protein PBAL39_09151 [Pedobacter sp. BAL39]|nr:hypothetical protein PBAL39_09151 [Pedobacter sp. BAL39]
MGLNSILWQFQEVDFIFGIYNSDLTGTDIMAKIKIKFKIC